MTEELVEPSPAKQMDETEQELSDLIAQSIQASSRESTRSLQAKRFEAGVSDLGYCSERLRRMIDQQVPEDTDYFKAFIGTAIGDHAEQAVFNHSGEEVVTQGEVEVTLRGDDRRIYHLTGHPDMVFPKRNLVLDGKTAFGLNLARRMGADQQKRFQRHLYGVGAFNAGLLSATDISEVSVGNVWFDRGGIESVPHVEIEPLDLSVVDEATYWLDDVVYAFTHGEEARKEPAREVCAVTCGFYRVCREFDTDVTGLLQDDTVVSAARMYDEGRDMERLGARLKKEAKAHLDGIEGSTGEFQIRWTWVNPTTIEAYVRRGYNKLEIKRIK